MFRDEVYEMRQSTSCVRHVDPDDEVNRSRMKKNGIRLGNGSGQLWLGVDENLVRGVEVEGIALVVLPIAVFDRANEFNWISIMVKKTLDGSAVGIATRLVVAVCDGVSEGENTKGGFFGCSSKTAEQPDKGEAKKHFRAS